MLRLSLTPLPTLRHSSPIMLEDVCEALHHLSSEAYGPCGRLLCVHSPLPTCSKGSGSVCDDIARLAPKNSPWRSPVARLLLQQVTTHSRQYGDGGWGLLLLATGLVLHTRRHLGAVPRPYIEWGLEMSLRWALEFLEDDNNPTRVPLCFAETEDLLGLVAAVMGSHPLLELPPEAKAHVYSEILLTFLHTLPSGDGPAPSARIQQCLQAAPDVLSPLSHSKVVEGVLVDWDLPLEAALLLPSWRAAAPSAADSVHRVLLFDVCLQPTAGSELVPLVPEARRRGNGAEDWCMRFVEQVKALGVKVLLSQKTIHPTLRLQLLHSSILPLERLSIRHMAAVRDLTGCTVVSDVHPPRNADVLGTLTSIGEQTIASKRFIHLCNTTKPTYTLFLVGDTRQILNAMEQAALRTLTVLRSAASQASAPSGAFGLAGAGAFELHLGEYVSARASHLSKEIPDATVRAQVNLAVQAFVTCVQAPVKRLVHSGGNTDVLQSFAELQEVNACSGFYRQLTGGDQPSLPLKCYGWDPVGDAPLCVASVEASGQRKGPVLDGATAKKAMLQSAIETALLLLRLDTHLIDLE